MVMLMKREANFFLLEKLAAVYGFWMREREDGGGGGGGGGATRLCSFVFCVGKKDNFVK